MHKMTGIAEDEHAMDKMSRFIHFYIHAYISNSFFIHVGVYFLDKTK